MKTSTFFGQVVGDRAMVVKGGANKITPRAIERRDDPGSLKIREIWFIPTMQHKRDYPELHWWNDIYPKLHL